MSSATPSTETLWDTEFLQGNDDADVASRHALIILNQPFSKGLLQRVWTSSSWHCCADGGANRLHDVFSDVKERELYKPDAIIGDLDSIRPEVKQYYESMKVPFKKDGSLYATDSMKCVEALKEHEAKLDKEFSLIFLGGLSGRLDQTIHILSYLHKLRLERKRVFAVTDDSIGWVLDSGDHSIKIDHELLGQTCGLLPVGIDSTNLSTKGLRWNLTDYPSSFDGLVSTSNHLLPEEETVWVRTTKPIWWTAEIKKIVLRPLERLERT